MYYVDSDVDNAKPITTELRNWLELDRLQRQVVFAMAFEIESAKADTVKQRMREQFESRYRCQRIEASRWVDF